MHCCLLFTQKIVENITLTRTGIKPCVMITGCLEQFTWVLWHFRGICSIFGKETFQHLWLALSSLQLTITIAFNLTFVILMVLDIQYFICLLSLFDSILGIYLYHSAVKTVVAEHCAVFLESKRFCSLFNFGSELIIRSLCVPKQNTSTDLHPALSMLSTLIHQCLSAHLHRMAPILASNLHKCFPIGHRNNHAHFHFHGHPCSNVCRCHQLLL
jgi:hypothetical protein